MLDGRSDRLKTSVQQTLDKVKADVEVLLTAMKETVDTHDPLGGSKKHREALKLLSKSCSDIGGSCKSLLARIDRSVAATALAQEKLDARGVASSASLCAEILAAVQNPRLEDAGLSEAVEDVQARGRNSGKYVTKFPLNSYE